MSEVINLIQTLPGVGEKFAKHLARLEIYTIHDLLLHLPIRYQDRTQVKSIREIRPGDEALVEGIIHRVEMNPRKRSRLVLELKDLTGSIYLRFFHAMAFQIQKLKTGVQLRCFSEVRLGPKGKEMVHPDFQVLGPNQQGQPEPYFTPIYPATEGISQYTLRKLSQAALMQLDDEHFFPDLLPQSVLQTFSLPPIRECLLNLHRPPKELDKLQLEGRQSIFHKRLIFEELLAHRLSLLHLKKLFQSEKSFSLHKACKLTEAFLSNLNFQLTAAQLRVKQEIDCDLEKPQPMLRLVQGDVGSGKTVVAALAMLKAIESGYQAANFLI